MSKIMGITRIKKNYGKVLWEIVEGIIGKNLSIIGSNLPKEKHQC